MRTTRLRWVGSVVFVFACGTPAGEPVDLGGPDAGASIDAGRRDAGAPTPDGGRPVDTGGAADGGGGLDAGSLATDAGVLATDASADGASADGAMSTCTPPSTGPAFSGCNPTMGIECDGDWRGINTMTGVEYCSPACSATDCCTPRMGTFVCVPRDAAGACPAADLFPDMTHIVGNYAVETQTFSPTSCAIVEGTLGGSGTRRLLRFDTWTPNIGTADMFLGVPDTTSGRFVYSPCHGHYHFETYAGYELLSADGRCVVAVGHKQAFCLEDFYHYPTPLNRSGARYTCAYQGIEMNWQDVYARIYDGQWIDVTDVAPGNYILRVRINTEHILNELNYDNDVIDVPVTIPAVVSMGNDITATCPAGTTGLNRTCGFTQGYAGSCTPGTTVTVGCSMMCGAGSCTGDTILRVCDTAVGTNCTPAVEITSNDDSGCGTGRCGRGGDCCSQAGFTCPSSGAYTVWTAAYDPTMAATCTVAHSP